MSDIIRLLQQSDPEPPVRRNAPLTPRGRAELRSLVGLAADPGADKRGVWTVLTPAGGRHLPQLLSVGLTALAIVVGVGWAGHAISQTSPNSHGLSTVMPTLSSSPQPSSSEAESPSPQPSPTPASPTPSPTPTTSATPTPGGQTPSGSPSTGSADDAAAAAARAAAAQAQAQAEAERKAAEEAAAQAAAVASAKAAAEAAAAPCAVGLSCGAGNLYGSTWRVTYAQGTSLSGQDTVQLGPDAWGENTVSFIVGADRCPLAATTHANMFVAQDNGAWDFGPNVQPKWQCEAPPDVPLDAYITALRDLGEARSWYMPNANTVEFWSNLANAVDRGQTQNLLVIFQK